MKGRRVWKYGGCALLCVIMGALGYWTRGPVVIPERCHIFLKEAGEAAQSSLHEVRLPGAVEGEVLFAVQVGHQLAVVVGDSRVPRRELTLVAEGVPAGAYMKAGMCGEFQLGEFVQRRVTILNPGG
ncbi:hypothetical protein LCGC14_2138620 [marine sediment metagenome]|uniref:Uncharacterized protein n=1 Tax=marine sediment metagenome TaxID=412755 RepID=A0A0F9DZ03_9ZZZZ